MLSAKLFKLFIISLFFVSSFAFSAGLLVSPPKAPEPFISEAFPDATRIADKAGDPLLWTAFKEDQIIGYAFETDDIARIPAYSGEPVNMLVAMDAQGTIVSVNVLEHHEPILLVGIPEHKLFKFSDQYAGLSVRDQVKIGGKPGDGMVHIDGLSGATVTVMVMNLGVMRAATKVARAVGILESDEAAKNPVATVNKSIFSVADWTALTGDGSIRRLLLNEGDIEAAFAGTEAANEQSLTPDEAKEPFADIYYTQLDIPTIGKNLLGEQEYSWLMETLQPGESAIALMGNGFSFKGSGYVRGGIFDRIQIVQGDTQFSFRDKDQHRINEILTVGTPRFREMSIFIIRDHHNFDLGSPWQFELLVRRQTGPLDSLFTSFKADYLPLEKYLIRPEPMPDVKELALWEQVWQERSTSINILVISMLILLAVLFLQDWLVKFPKFMQGFRLVFLTYTVVFIGWYWLGQLSVVNVLTFVKALMSDFHWDLFLLDPIIFILWGFVAATILLWGRGVYCGWLCPFGALQELLSQLAVRLKIPQIVVPYALHERLWAVKYLVLLALFGLSLDSLSLAEQYAEVEPFKTTFLLRFDRDWPFIIYVASILFVSLFSQKVYCRYVCPLGAALAIPTGMRLFDWLKRRKDCGSPCQICANECEIGAIEPGGKINMRECHQCLDCQVTYHSKTKCPPLIKKENKRNKMKRQSDAEPQTDVVRFVEGTL